MNTPKTIEERIIELRGITLKIEELINTRFLNKYLGLKTTQQDVAKDILSESFNIKIKELIAEQERISRESEKSRIIEQVKNSRDIIPEIYYLRMVEIIKTNKE